MEYRRNGNLSIHNFDANSNNCSYWPTLCYHGFSVRIRRNVTFAWKIETVGIEKWVRKLNNKFILGKYWWCVPLKMMRPISFSVPSNVFVANYEPKVFRNSMEKSNERNGNLLFNFEWLFVYLSRQTCCVWAYEPIWIISLEFESGWLIWFFSHFQHENRTVFGLACEKSIYQWKIACKTDFSNRN